MPPWLVSVAPAVSAIAAVAAVVVAGASLGVSIGSRRLAKRSLRISEQKAERESLSLLIDQVAVEEERDSTGARLIVPELRILNRSDRPNSVSSLALWVNYEIEGRAISSEFSPLDRVGCLSAPLRLESRQVIQGKVAFRLDPERTARWTFLSYDIELSDADGRVARFNRLSVKGYA